MRVNRSILAVMSTTVISLYVAVICAAMLTAEGSLVGLQLEVAFDQHISSLYNCEKQCSAVVSAQLWCLIKCIG
jgi:hypothetical protein